MELGGIAPKGKPTRYGHCNLLVSHFSLFSSVCCWFFSIMLIGRGHRGSHAYSEWFLSCFDGALTCSFLLFGFVKIGLALFYWYLQPCFLFAFATPFVHPTQFFKLIDHPWDEAVTHGFYLFNHVYSSSTSISLLFYFSPVFDLQWCLWFLLRMLETHVM